MVCDHLKLSSVFRFDSSVLKNLNLSEEKLGHLSYSSLFNFGEVGVGGGSQVFTFKPILAFRLCKSQQEAVTSPCFHH